MANVTAEQIRAARRTPASLCSALPDRRKAADIAYHAFCVKCNGSCRNSADDSNARNRVCTRHQRSVQLRGYFRDQLYAEKTGYYKYKNKQKNFSDCHIFLSFLKVYLYCSLIKIFKSFRSNFRNTASSSSKILLKLLIRDQY